MTPEEKIARRFKERADNTAFLIPIAQQEQLAKEIKAYGDERAEAARREGYRAGYLRWKESCKELSMKLTDSKRR